ncbi:MAG: metallophosphoesterase family protein [Acidobacteria bacterium]|nr:metallophosphoesterase family protein [Acidobacteriota bacterium]
MRIALVSDIHSNNLALEAVLDDLSGKNIEKILDMGDSLYGPIDPASTYDLLIESHVISVSGNQDYMLVYPTEEVEHSPSYKFTISKLEDEHFKWLSKLKLVEYPDDDIIMFHGTPDSDSIYLLREIDERGAHLSTPKNIEKKLVGIKQKIILCGHDHMPQVVTLDDGRTIINPGSVGCPAYDDTLPFPHSMNSGSPHAKYTIIEMTRDGVRVEMIQVPYDYRKAAEIARANGRDDWYRWLTTGFAK